ncbi:unnamed protein product [Diatraea saccharalis]|uniref:Uncharacterized protein n=1 Tax=Diatraea saccharalis TaxID=40085 RepID=A0A9N9WC24_9NEOP|nr:unnamed protein product [Diatraea saccharalis]
MPFLQSKKFKAMNVGVSLDEGAPVNIPEVPVFYQDKVAWQIRVNCYGTTEHGSAFQPTNITATGKLESLIYSAGDNITITYLSKNPQSPATVANSSNPFWTAIEKTAEEM